MTGRPPDPEVTARHPVLVYIREHNLTVFQAASGWAIPYQTLHAIVHLKRRPGLELCAKLSEATGIPMDEIAAVQPKPRAA